MELTASDWEYISALVAADIRSDLERDLYGVASRHANVWEKIQAIREAAEGDDQ